MDISREMRAILVDWMVEVQVGGRGEGARSSAEQLPPHRVYGTQEQPQGASGFGGGEDFGFFLTPPASPNPASLQENFELNHETLYLAVKLVDHYLVEVVSMKDKLQLIGSTAVLIASKFEVTPGVGCGVEAGGLFGRILGPRGTD